MINGVGNFFKPQNVADKSKNETELSIFYINDTHGDVNKATKVKTAKDCFEKQNKASATLSLGAGDLFYGKDKNRNNIIAKFINALKLDAITLGNHEFDGGSKTLSENLSKLNTTSIVTNLDLPKTNSLQERIADKKLVKSATFMKGGHKFAVIGAAPFDTDITCKDKPETAVKQMNLDNTIKAINTEVKKLENQGINKIILCSHLGYGEHADLKVARETEGVDIIIGGHSHDLIEGANKKDNGGTEKLNIVKSKRGETVVITQAGAKNSKAGFLNIIFDKHGVIKDDKIINKLANVDNFKSDKKLDKEFSNILGANKTLFTSKTEYTPINEFQERYMENPVTNVLADSILAKAKKLDKDVLASVHTSNTLKSGINKTITTYDVKYDMLPYDSEHKIVDITEEDFIKLLEKTSGQIFNNTDPLLLRCSGMKYTIDEKADKSVNGHIKSLEFVDTNNKVVKTIDVRNPSKTNTLKIAMLDYLFMDKDTKNITVPYESNATIVGNEQEIFSNYLLNNPNVNFENSSEKRIQINYQNLEKYCPQYSMTDKLKALQNS